MISTRKPKLFVLVFYGLMAILFVGTAYFVSNKDAITDQRNKAATAVSCEYEITIPTPASPSLGGPTPTSQAVVVQTPETVIATPTIPDVVCNKKADIAIVIDRSTSMAQRESNGKTKLELAREAAKIFVTAIKESDSHNVKIGVVSFGGQGNDQTGLMSREYDSTLHIGASSDYTAVLAAIDGITDLKPWTCVQCGIRIGNQQIVHSPNAKAMILLTDGVTNRAWNGTSTNAKSLATAEAADGRQKGIVYHVVGFGDKTKNQIDETTLKTIAGSTSQYTYKPDATTWTKGFLDLLPQFCLPVTP